MKKNAEKNLIIGIILATITSGILLISNLSATKLWNFFGIAVDGGIIVFPISYIIGDIVVEIFGKKTAGKIILMSFFLNFFASMIFLLVGLLPAYPGWDGQEAYMRIFGFVPRVVFGSLFAYLISGLINNVVFEKIKNKTGEKKYFLRSIGSSIVAKFFDSAIFETVAFFGVLSASEFLLQAGFAYIAGLFLEIVLTPLSYFCIKKIKKFLDSK